MKQIHYPRLEETLYSTVLENGLRVLVLPKPGFSRKIAYFVTDFGSIHTEFSLDGQLHRVPAGIAHYLEHKLFDMPRGDVTPEFAALGANPNAFTGYDMTAYYFSCTDHFSQCLQLLLEFVSTPYFTDESVEKERGIIAQEIMMCDDTSENRVFDNLARGAYREHPVAVPILGTQESIAAITKEDLYLCHRAFYTPKNMLLCVVGDVDPHQVEDIARRILPETAPMPAVKRTPREQSLDTPQKEVQEQMEISMPTFLLGLKIPPMAWGEEGIRQEFVTDLAVEALLGESSELYMQLYDSGLIDSSFGGSFESMDGAAMVLCGGDSQKPRQVRDAVLRRLQTLAQTGIREEDFRRMKKSALGRRIRDLSSFESTCYRLCACKLTGFDYLEFPRLFASVTKEDVQKCLQDMAQTPGHCLSIIYPKGDTL